MARALGLCVMVLILANVPARAESTVHRVVAGDTLRGILTRYNCVRSMARYSQLREEFARLNPAIFHSGMLVEGMDIQVPRGDKGGGCLQGALARVVRLEFEAGTTSETVRVYLDGPVLPDLFMLKTQSPHRLVCDFDDTLPRADLVREMPVEGRLVRKIRVGHEDKPFRRARIVLELEDVLAGRVEQFFFERESLFAVTVHEALE